ncbi:MAG: hypothetical protein V1862_12215 [Methanobacteriota archaeon]
MQGDTAGCSKRPSERWSLRTLREAISTINPKEFRPVDGWPDKKSGIVFGRKPTHYQGRWNPANGKKKPEKGKMLCKACYHRSVMMKSSQFRTIPSVIDISRLKRWIGPSVGRCHVCDGDSIIWKYPADHFGMCETCYAQLCQSTGKVTA